MMERHTKRAQGIAVRILGAVVSMLAIAAVVPMFFGALAGVASEVSDIVTYTGPGVVVDNCHGGDDGSLSATGSPVAASGGGVWGPGVSYPAPGDDNYHTTPAAPSGYDGDVSAMVVFRSDEVLDGGGVLIVGHGKAAKLELGLVAIPSAPDGRVGIYASGGLASNGSTPSNYGDGAIHVAVLTFSDAGAANLYYDGAAYSLSSLTRDVITGDQNLFVTAPVSGAPGAVADVYEVRVWDRVLSPAEGLALSGSVSEWPALTGDETEFYCFGDVEPEPPEDDYEYDSYVVSFITFLPLLAGFTGLMALVGLILATVQLRR